jgi:hypothetical protein
MRAMRPYPHDPLTIFVTPQVQRAGSHAIWRFERRFRQHGVAGHRLEALLAGMSNYEMTLAKHLPIGFWHHGNIAEIIKKCQTQNESQSS